MTKTITPEQSKAARALLTWSQQDLAKNARVSLSTVADFERGARIPVANNLDAMHDALVAEGLEFVAGGVVEKTQLLFAPAAPRPGALMRWINATHLSTWGGTRDGQGSMAELLRRLIYAAKGPAATVRFPSDESVQLGGWDGICTVATGDQYVPTGISGWEIGGQRRGIRGKADADYAKRAGDPLGLDPSETTFVFVTPQRFTDKENWIAEKQDQGAWRDVRVIDADDLVHWLELYPAVAQWLAVKIGRRPEGLRNLEEAWDEWARATGTPLTTDIILTDRDADATAILKWLRDAPSLFSLQAEAPEEAVAFLYAAMSPLPDPHKLSYWSRCVVAADDDTARQLIGIGSRLIVALTDPDPGLAMRLADDGNHVFAAYGPDVTVTGNTRRLARPWRHNLRAALRKADQPDKDAHRLAQQSGRSITVLRRLMPAAPNFRPNWIANAPPELITAMLAGSWVETSAADRKILNALAGRRSYDQVEAVLAPFSALVGGPLVRSGPAWKVTSLRDLWTLLAPSLSTTQIERFETAFQQVLGAPNPRFDADPKETLFETEGQFGEEASPELRRGLIQAMIALGVYSDLASGVANAPRRAERAVQKLLGKADARLWWSLCRDFKGLAEAAPAAFLDAVDAGFDGNDPPVMALFRSEEGFIMRTEYLSALLWALEMLARSPEYLPRAALLLARLDEVDPGGSWGNRPAASLRRIFVTWSPQTYATSEQRLKVIDAVVRRYPEVGWRLLAALAPRFHDVSEPSPLPDWRDFALDELEEITLPALQRTAQEIGSRLLEHVGHDGSRWKTLLGFWSNFAPEWRGKAAKLLAAHARALNSVGEIETLRDDLRDLLHRHRSFSTANWALPAADLEPLDAIFQGLEALGPEDRNRWLFNPNHMFFRPNVPWQEAEAEVETRRVEAASELLAALSPEKLIEFTRTVSMHHALGVALSTAEGHDDTKSRIIELGLLADDAAAADLATAMLFCLAGRLGVVEIDRWWQRAITEGWGELAELRIVGVLPIEPATWERIAKRSPNLYQTYWSKINIWAIRCADLERVATELIEAGRAYDAIDWLGQHIKDVPSGQLLVEVLQAALHNKATPPPDNATMFSHYLGQILDRIEADPDVDDGELVALEWGYFQVLRHSSHPPRALRRELARNPDFFALLIRTIWLRDDGDETPEEREAHGTPAMIEQAYHVLDDWARVPGSDDNGVIDTACLEDWVKRARKLCADAGRSEIGDQKIGGILAASLRVADQPWPPEPVREVIDMVRSRSLERGFELGVFNRRGVTVRMPFDGGEQERGLAARFRRDADELRFEWTRTAACLERIAEIYEEDAQRMDQGAEQRDW